MTQKKTDHLSHFPTIIAIGGAKGGIGKSMLCANLGVYLSSQGHRTIIVDLDLGGANLHLFMGMWSLTHKLQDYLDKKKNTIEEILVKTPYGPLLAGGGGGKLGSAHIPFVRKLKLLKALRNIAADYIILDLGGDTTFNSLDYFLAADVNIVLTTCDPASYLDAYNFIKMALYRKLTRIFGPETQTDIKKDPALTACIEKFVNNGISGSGLRMEALLKTIAENHLAHLSFVKDRLHHFQPYFLINMTDRSIDTEQLAHRLIKVSQSMLSINLNYIGSIARAEDVKECTIDLVPHVVRYPQGILSDFFSKMSVLI